MATNLVIVESPAKAKTIEKFLGPEYTVTSSFGHIRDLPRKGMSIDVNNNFEPTYEINPDKKKQVAELKKLVKSHEQVWLATDEDREGEAIAWHLCQALGLSETETKRIVFHEITKQAIEEAIKAPRTLDKHLVDAQQARRVLDRLVGYELSPVLWKKVQRGLSAGRVQSVAVRLIVEREREIEGFSGRSDYKVTANFKADDSEFSAELPKRLEDGENAKTWLGTVANAQWSVADLKTKPATKSPSPPFTTSTLQQAASRTLGFSVRQTMVVAQKLYESGQITYMRTDSVALSELAIKQASEVIKSKFGPDFHQERRFTTKSAGAQEAHEAIRPTDLSVESIRGDSSAQKLYRLIWQRALASQMAGAQIEKTLASIANTKNQDLLEAKGEMVQFAGYLRIYKDTDDTSKLLPALTTGQQLDLIEAVARETFTKPRGRFTEASLVKRLEELGIGRPSTYAPTISTIQDRGYVEKGDRAGNERTVGLFSLKEGVISEQTETEAYGAEKSKLYPTDIARLVTDFLVKYFPDVIDYGFTAQVEAQFDQVASGKTIWQNMIKDFYKDFHNYVGAAEEVSRAEAAQARELGVDPASGKPVLVRMGRYGPMVQIGLAEDDEKPRFAGLPRGTTMEAVTLEEALELFKLPRELGKTSNGEVISTNFGRFGPYVKYGAKYVAITPDDPFSITLERAQELIADKEAKDAAKTIADFGEIKILNGRFGPYVTDGKKNAKIPKELTPESLDKASAAKLLAEAPAKKRFTRRKK